MKTAEAEILQCDAKPTGVIAEHAKSKVAAGAK
jgi:hypothetical protein